MFRLYLGGFLFLANVCMGAKDKNLKHWLLAGLLVVAMLGDIYYF